LRVALATLGCKVNQYDSAVMERLFHERGWQQVAYEEPADAYVVNSCTVTDRADAEARRLARRARRTNPDSRVILTGCYAQTNPQQIAELPYVDYVIGLGRLPELLRAVAGELDERLAVSDLRKAETIETLGISSFPGRTRAFVKVQEGCDLFCSFCIIPVARGRSRSVSPRQVVEEIARLEGRGYREVVLTGIHLGGYGADLHPPRDLSWLLETIAERAPSLRIRISSVDPPEINPRLVEIVAAGSLFCRHFHVPIQSGDDTVLSNMRRRYRAEDAEAAIALLRAHLPEVAVGTDIITGFPGETDEQFEHTVGFLERLEPSYLHVFPYSRRRATSAAKRWVEVPAAVVHERARRLRALDRQLRCRYQERFLGRKVRVLFEHERDAASGKLRGYSDNYLPVLCEGPDGLMNRLSDVIVSARSHSGRLLSVLA
jgi:threonylcarbamoyladenosine tRNA methylthiotransferase MtaB